MEREGSKRSEVLPAVYYNLPGVPMVRKTLTLLPILYLSTYTYITYICI